MGVPGHVWELKEKQDQGIGGSGMKRNNIYIHTQEDIQKTVEKARPSMTSQSAFTHLLLRFSSLKWGHLLFATNCLAAFLLHSSSSL